MASAYAMVSALIFAVVAVVHLFRLLKRWPVQIGSYLVPMSASWLGLAVSALLAVWGAAQISQ